MEDSKQDGNNTSPAEAESVPDKQGLTEEVALAFFFAKGYKLERVVQAYCRYVLTRKGERVAQAARWLGIGRTTLYRYMDGWK